MEIGGRSSSKRTGRKSSSTLIEARLSELKEELVNVDRRQKLVQANWQEELVNADRSSSK